MSSAGGIIDLSMHRNGRNGFNSGQNTMTVHDLNVLLKVVEDTTEKQYDPILFCEVLLKERIISNRVYHSLSKMYESGEGLRKILIRLFQVCSLSSIIYSLQLCGYTDIAKMIQSIRQNTNPYGISKYDCCHDSAMELYSAFKKNIDNDTFTDKNAVIQSQLARLSRELADLNPEHIRRRNCLVDKLMVMKCLAVEVITNPDERLAALNGINQDVIFSFKTVAKAPIYDKEACTCALTGDFISAEQLMTQARLILHNAKPSWPVFYHYLNELFLKVAEFKEQPTEESKQNLLFLGYSGLKSVANETETKQRQWKRMYISFMLYGVLCLGLFLEEIPCRITEEDRKMAKTLLAAFNSLSEGMETRRDMLYAFFMARLHEKDNLQLALAYAKRAKLLSDSGELRKGEKENIAAFLHKLTVKLSDSS